jgi:hypothetical protein
MNNKTLTKMNECLSSHLNERMKREVKYTLNYI